MKNLYKTIFILFLLLTQIQCKKNENPVAPDPNAPTFTDNITQIQKNNDDLLTNLLTKTDTSAALDSVVKVFLKDTSVQNAGKNSQGVWVKYKSGIIGGIMLDPEDGYTYSFNKNKGYQLPVLPYNTNEFLPTSKKVIFLNPSYAERTELANSLIDLYQNVVTKNGYSLPVIKLDEKADLAAFTSLAGYGIIHIYSHGWAYPTKHSITEVYLMTGEEINAASNEKYKEYLYSGDIPLIKTHEGKDVYYISPDFFGAQNNLSNDSSMVYGGFCFSFRGGWPNALIDKSIAGAYTGFTWRVETNWNVALALSLFDTLSNNTLSEPRTLDYWFTSTPAIPKELWDPFDKLYCKIQYAGHSPLTLWKPFFVTVSPNPAKALINESITFTAKAQKKLTQQVKYKWNFGDNSTEQVKINDSTVSHTYSTAGTYSVMVTVLDLNDNQLAKSYGSAIITNSTQITYSSVSVYLTCKVRDSWKNEGKYWNNGVLRDTVWTGIQETGYGENYTWTITMSGNSFYGIETVNNPNGNSYTYKISGTYDPAGNSANATITYSFSGFGYGTGYHMTIESTLTLSLPGNGPSENDISFGATGLNTCGCISTLNFKRVQTPDPPYGVTLPGIKMTSDYTSFFCDATSRASITLKK